MLYERTAAQVQQQLQRFEAHARCSCLGMPAGLDLSQVSPNCSVPVSVPLQWPIIPLPWRLWNWKGAKQGLRSPAVPMAAGAGCPLPSCPPNHKFGRRRHEQKCFSIDFCWRARIMRFVRQAIVLRDLIAREEDQKPSQCK